MTDIVKEIIVWASPIVAGFITSVLIPFIIKKVAVKHLKEKIEEVSPTKEYKELKDEISELKKEILALRGKRKWRNIQYCFCF